MRRPRDPQHTGAPAAKRSQKRGPRPEPNGPFSRLMSLDELAGLPGGRIEIEASAEECRALAEAIDVPEIKSLHADVHVLIQPREVTLSGEVTSRLFQLCGVTLDPFETEVREPIDIRFAPVAEVPPAAKARRDTEAAVPADHDALADDPPEPLVGDYIDLGTIAAEFLVLGLDPYPRKPGVEFSGAGDEETDPASANNAFAALAKLRSPGSEGKA
jgi:hypothetical protein